MLIQPISNHQQSFKAVNQKYFAWAKKDIKRGGNVSTEWIQRLGFDVYLFRKISHQDAIDTVSAVKKILTEIDVCLENLLKGFERTKLNP